MVIISLNKGRKKNWAISADTNLDVILGRGKHSSQGCRSDYRAKTRLKEHHVSSLSPCFFYILYSSARKEENQTKKRNGHGGATAA